MERTDGGSGSPPALPTSPPPARTGISELGSVVVGLSFGGLLALLILVNGDDGGIGAVSVALAVQYSAPGLLALFARRRRPGLYLAAGVVGMIVPFITMSALALPLVVPAGMSLVAYGRRSGEFRPRLADPVVAVLSFVLVMASWASLSLHQDPYCHTGPNFSECGSDAVTSVEAAFCAAFSVALIVVPFVLAAPKRERSHA